MDHYDYQKLPKDYDSDDESDMSVRQKQASSNLLGMSLAILSHTLFVFSMIIVKSSNWNKILIYETRTLDTLIICIVLYVVFFVAGKPFVFFGEPGQRLWLFFRAFTYFICVVGCYQSLSYLEIGDATTIQYTSPVISGLIGFIWLREPFHWMFFITTFLNFTGLVFVTKPSFLFEDKSLDMVGVGFACLSAVGWGICIPFTRKTRESQVMTVESTTQFLVGMFFAPIALYIKTQLGRPVIDYDRHGIEEFPWFMIALLSCVCFTSLVFLTLASQMCYSNLIASIALIEIPCSYVVQHFLFEATIDFYGLVGCCAILTAGILNFVKEAMIFYNQEEATSKVRESIKLCQKHLDDSSMRSGQHAPDTECGGAYKY